MMTIKRGKVVVESCNLKIEVAVKTILLSAIAILCVGCCPQPKTYPVPENLGKCIIIGNERQENGSGWVTVLYWRCKLPTPHDSISY